MKRIITILVIVLSFTIHLNASAADAISLKFSYSPTECPTVYLLPNGYYEAVYYTPNTSEFWIDQGYDDVTNCVIEVFDAAGDSVWCFPVLRVDIFQDDTDAFFYQNVVLPDQIEFEYYWDHSYERYVSKKWSFDGKQLPASFDSTKQSEDAFRYIRSQYPYTLVTWPFGKTHDTPARLTYVVDGSAVDLPFSYGVSTTCVAENGRFYMLYEADDISEGEPGTVYLLTYAPDTHKLTTTRTNLASCSGHMAVSNNALVFLQEISGQAYMLYTVALTDVEQEILCFSETSEITIGQNEVIENIIPTEDYLLCLKSKVIEESTGAEHHQSELCVLSAEGELVSVHSWDRGVNLLQSSTASLLFISEDRSGGYQVVELSHEDINDLVATLTICP